MKIIRWLTCFFLGHVYRPSYSLRGFQHANCPNGRIHKKQVQYECYICNKLTPWMNRAQHSEFIQKHNPTWGPRGSDSQGNRTKGNKA